MEDTLYSYGCIIVDRNPGSVSHLVQSRRAIAPVLRVSSSAATYRLPPSCPSIFPQCNSTSYLMRAGPSHSVLRPHCRACMLAVRILRLATPSIRTMTTIATSTSTNTAAGGSAAAVRSITLPAASDMHVHLRQGDLMRMVVPHIRKGGVHRVLVMVRQLRPSTLAEEGGGFRYSRQRQDTILGRTCTCYIGAGDGCVRDGYVLSI